MKRLFGLIGYPLEHSYSAHFFSNKFENENITDCSYRLFPIRSIDKLPEILDTYNNLEGLNVTIPFKEQVIPYLNYLSESASKIGAVNTIRISKSNFLSGYNTDYYGFMGSLKPLLKPYHKDALILGNGGSAKAIKYALKLLNINYRVISRKKSEETIIYEELDDSLLCSTFLVINTTPLGMYPQNEQCPPINYKVISRKHLLYDLIYNPAETLFIKKGKSQGAATKNGLEMLKIQAERSWQIWNDDSYK